MGWLHATNIWYLISVAYLLVCWRIPTSIPLTAPQLLLRAFAAAASSANVLISDGYHNADKRGGDAYTSKAETLWLRWDYVGISCVLTSLLWLWSSNLAFAGQLMPVSIASGVSTALVAALSAFAVPRKAGHTAVKLIMGAQFVGMLGYLALKSVVSATCCSNAIIFWVYAPGLILYVLKWPQSQVFGFHELFHTSVLAGHVVSMLCDVGDIVVPCARACVL